MSTGVVIGLALGGLVLLAVAGGLVRYARGQSRRADLAAGTETSTCGEIAELASSVSGEVGSPMFRQRCEVKGRARAEGSELTGPLSEQPCVWYRSTITHKYWETDTDRDSDGDTHTRRVERSRVVSDETSQVPFAVDDGTGTLVVDPREANIDSAEQSFDRFEPDTGGDQGRSISAFGINVNLGANSGSLGFQREEWILRPNASLYLLGEVSDASGRLQLTRPAEGGELLISTRSEEQLVSGARKKSRLAVIGAAAATTIGAGLVLAALIGLVAG